MLSLLSASQLQLSQAQAAAPGCFETQSQHSWASNLPCLQPWGLQQSRKAANRAGPGSASPWEGSGGSCGPVACVSGLLWLLAENKKGGEAPYLPQGAFIHHTWVTKGKHWVLLLNRRVFLSAAVLPPRETPLTLLHLSPFSQTPGTPNPQSTNTCPSQPAARTAASPTCPWP